MAYENEMSDIVIAIGIIFCMFLSKKSLNKKNNIFLENNVKLKSVL